MERLLNLKYINLVNNQIESFPYFLGRLPSLEVILFDQNPYTNVSKEFIAQSPFTLLPALRQYVFDHKDLEDGAMAANAVDVSQFPLLHLSSINDYNIPNFPPFSPSPHSAHWLPSSSVISRNTFPPSPTSPMPTRSPRETPPTWKTAHCHWRHSQTALWLPTRSARKRRDLRFPWEMEGIAT